MVCMSSIQSDASMQCAAVKRCFVAAKQCPRGVMHVVDVSSVASYAAEQCPHDDMHVVGIWSPAPSAGLKMTPPALPSIHTLYHRPSPLPLTKKTCTAADRTMCIYNMYFHKNNTV